MSQRITVQFPTDRDNGFYFRVFCWADDRLYPAIDMKGLGVSGARNRAYRRSQATTPGEVLGLLKKTRMRFLLVFVILLVSVGCRSMPATEQAPPATVSTFLMFQEGNAQDAISLYASVLPGVRVERIERYGPGEPGPEGTVKLARVDLNGHRVMFSDSYVKHAFTFTPSVSLFVDFASAGELDAAFAKLSEGGAVMMPLDNYGFSRRFGWCSDRFGVSWQLNLPETSSTATTRPAR